VKAVVFGNREMGCACLEELLAHEVEVPLVVTYPRDPREAPGFRCLAEFAASHGIAVTTPEDAQGRELLDWARGLQPDAVFSFYYGHRIPKTVRRVARLGALNLHGALLPRWRGRAPLPWVILEGETESGVTLHDMVDAMDAGDIVAQVRFPVAPRETATSLYAKSVAASRVLLRRVLPLLAQGRAPHARQDESKATVTPPLASRRDVDRTASVERFDRTVRAFARPYPGARTTLGTERVLVWAGEPDPAGSAGLVLPLADGTFRVDRIGFEDGPEVDAAEFVRQHPEAPDLVGLPRRPGER